MLLLLYPAWATPPAPPVVVTIAYVRAQAMTTAVIALASPQRATLRMDSPTDATAAFAALTDTRAHLTSPTEATLDG